MPIMQDEEGRTISVDRHEDRGVILPGMEPVSEVGGPQQQDGGAGNRSEHLGGDRPQQPTTDKQSQPRGDASAKDAGKIIDQSDKGGANEPKRTEKASKAKAQKADNKDASPQRASEQDRDSSQNVDLSAGIRPEDQDDALRGGVDTLKTPQERRKAGSGDEPTFANRDLSRSETRERGEAMK